MKNIERLKRRKDEETPEKRKQNILQDYKDKAAYENRIKKTIDAEKFAKFHLNMMDAKKMQIPIHKLSRHKT